MQRMRVLRRPALSVAILSLFLGTGHQEFFGVSGIGSITWRWTDVYLGTPMRPADDPRIKEKFKIMRRVVGHWRQRHQLQGKDASIKPNKPSDVIASAMKHGLKWEPDISGFGRHPLKLFRDADAPWASASRLHRMEEQYWPLIKEYLDAPEPEKKKLLDAWIPAINNATLEAKLKKAIKEQWRLEIGPGQKNDPYRLPRNIREGTKIARRDSRHFFGEDAKEGTNAWSTSNNWILDLERTFGFGYQLLRSCAVDGYGEQYFQDVEKKWEKVFQETHNWVERMLNAMQPPPGRGLAGDEVGEDEKVSKATYEDRRALWSGMLIEMYDEDFWKNSFLMSKFRGGEASQKELQADFLALLGNGFDDGEEEAERRDAVRSILKLPAASAVLNEQDYAQQKTGGRLSRYPKTLTLEEKAVFRARRSVIEGERQTEDLRIYAREGVHVLQSALLPFAYSYNSMWRQRDETRKMWADIKQELENAVETSRESLSPKVKAVARHALRFLEEVPELTQQQNSLQRQFSAEVPSQLYESPGADDLPHPWEEESPEKVEAERVDDNAGSACVRLFAWAKRHQVLSRMARLNLATRLKVLVDDGAKFGGELSVEDLVERETPTAVGPVVGKSGSPLALKENQNYTNLFYLLRDNVGKKLEEVPPLKWEDFDEWGKQYPHLVRTTPWDEEYVPPWEWPNGVPPDRGDQKQDDESYYRSWFFVAVAGIAVFALALAVVSLLLFFACRRHRAALQRRRSERQAAGTRKVKVRWTGAGQEQQEQEQRRQKNLDAGGIPARQRVRSARGTATRRAVTVPPSPARAPAAALSANYPLFVRDHGPPAGGQTESVGVGHMQEPTALEWQAVMGLQLHDSQSGAGVDQGQVVRLHLPPPENPHAPARIWEQVNAAEQPVESGERAAVATSEYLAPLPGPHQYEVDGQVLGATGLVVPNRPRVPRAPPNSHVTGASESETGAGVR